MNENRQSVTFGTLELTTETDDLGNTGIFHEIKGLNTYDDLKLIATTRPIFTPPVQKTNLIDIPGADGALDFSEALTGYPIFNNREGSFVFYVMNDEKTFNGLKDWSDRYSDLMQLLHTKKLCAVLKEDPDYFYRGRFQIVDWKSEDTWSQVTIGYNVEPYKWSILNSTDAWKWDPFKFPGGIIFGNIFKNFSFDVYPGTWDSRLLPGSFFGDAPVSPIVTVKDISPYGAQIKFINTRLNTSVQKAFIASDKGKTFDIDFIFWGNDEYEIQYMGGANLSIDFRIGRF